jgi:D-beta-D-heptose 7-phosphate kinase/D-beta-D-heptose 1-phosphate adenosyltransferase
MTPEIGVVGDSMIDQYYSVKIKKISPEFPIPVMHSSNDECKICPGGAANVAHQFLHFDVDVKLISFLDEEAEKEFNKKRINTENCLIIKNKIPRKKRFYSDNFPTYRWDVEDQLYGLKEDLNNKCKELYLKNQNKIKELDAVIFSDYDKGVFIGPDNLSNFIKHSKISVVDSKTSDVDRWFGCTVFKPNLSESFIISGKNDPIEAGKWIKSRIRCKYVVITNAEKGVFIIGGDNNNHWSKTIEPDHKFSQAQSVIGAGDCFTAMLTLQLVKGSSIEDSVDFAWRAGLNYVKNKFNYPVCESDLVKNKYIKNPKILSKRNFKLVFTNGVYDILHAGHIELLRFAKSKGDKLVVAVNSDESTSNIKKDRPIVGLEDRIKLLSSLEFVDFIVSFDENTPLEIIKEIKPDVLVKGSEYFKENIVGSDIVPETITCTMLEGRSTTNIIKKIKGENHD